MTTSPAYVCFRAVQKSYDGRNIVVRDLNLDIFEGEFLTLLGPSGSGKTTSLMMLAGFETPTAGEILLGGAPLHTVAPHRRNIGMVFQNYALFPHMTVQENLAFPLSVRRMSRAEQATKVGRALDMVRLGHLAQRYPGQLSGGQQQRIALARALVFEPKLVLMDEPLGALDKQLREQMQLEIRRLHRELGLTVVFVTHDQAEALTLSDRVAVFNDGVIQQIDTPQTLYERPGNSFVAQFIGENNVLHGTVAELDGPWCSVRLPDGQLVGARASAEVKLGQASSVSIRPERIALSMRLALSAGAGNNRLPGRVAELIYLGDHVRVRLDLGGRNDFMAKVPISQMESSWAVGADVPVTWQRNDAMALDPIAV
jgi:putative spermidine/putrescine transport system ATP-binding protein